MNLNLYGCTGVGSCYQPGADERCCGCVNWEEEGIDVPAYPATKSCENRNANWDRVVKPTLFWLKKACPTAYTYPYDDVSSTFVCSHMEGKVNTANYEITFCPQKEVK
jgi:hypothetical protein